MRMRQKFPLHHRLILLLSLLALAGCANDINMQVESEVPTPLSEKIPLSVGIYYNDNFRNFVFKENSEVRKDWTIDTRTSRMSLFNEILPSMFNSVTPVTEPAAVGSGVDVVIEPEVVDMQVAMPEETHSDIYEAWIKYEIKMYHPTGAPLSTWQITGYGKSHTALFKKREKGLNTAINMAMRDIGAKLVLDFPRAPGVREWLVSKVNCSEFSKVC